MGPDDITATDIEYNITLTGLEEDNTYNISVVSTNCEGSVKTSSPINFTIEASGMKDV